MRLGILGFGCLGQALLPVTGAFGMDIAVWSPHLTADRVTPNGANISKRRLHYTA